MLEYDSPNPFSRLRDVIGAFDRCSACVADLEKAVERLAHAFAIGGGRGAVHGPAAFRLTSARVAGEGEIDGAFDRSIGDAAMRR
ncbi:hypothetical protein [Burkholderia humptydooensis]|uniref:hypothetical protein n=1 Tax=Burkholderia humptydooensis TaxID=430531 RepID=UPI0010FECA87|nr:hypothetical protein [Burkholderia humptydooensis]